MCYRLSAAVGKGVFVIASTAVMSIRINDLATLQGVYMPFLKNAGIFVSLSPSVRQNEAHGTFSLNNSVCLLLQLPDDSRRYFCIAKIVWITPAQLRSGKIRGVGLQFDRQAVAVRSSIETRLSSYQGGISKSQTL